MTDIALCLAARDPHSKGVNRCLESFARHSTNNLHYGMIDTTPSSGAAEPTNLAVMSAYRLWPSVNLFVVVAVAAVLHARIPNPLPTPLERAGLPTGGRGIICASTPG